MTAKLGAFLEVLDFSLFDNLTFQCFGFFTDYTYVYRNFLPIIKLFLECTYWKNPIHKYLLSCRLIFVSIIKSSSNDRLDDCRDVWVL